MNNSEFQGTRVVVTGGAGFVGGNVARRLVELGAKVVVLDDFFTGKMENLPPTGAEIVRGSVCDDSLVRDVIRGATYVFHEAARNIIVSTKAPREDCDTNVVGTVNVLLAARDLGVTRVVYASSASVYGNGRYLPTSEEDPPSITNPYAASKYAGESYARAFYETYGLPVASVRYSNVYGTLQRPDNAYCGVVAKFFAAALAGKPLRVHGDGEQTRDYTYVEDAVGATLLAAIAPGAAGRVYNVGTGHETSVNRLATMILELTESPSTIEYVEKRDIDSIQRRVLRIERARSELRWAPMTNLRAGLRRTLDWVVASSGAS